MPQIKSALSAIKEANLINLKPKHKTQVEDYAKQLMALQHKAHEPRSFQYTVKLIIQQHQELVTSLQKMEVGFSPFKAYRRRNEVLKTQSALNFIKDCTTGNFAINYQKKNQEFLAFLKHAEFARFLRPGADFLRTIHELLTKDDSSLIYLLEEHLEQGVFKEEYNKQFNELILLMKLKACYNSTPKINSLFQKDYSLLNLENAIEQQRILALIKGQESLARALKYLAMGCQLTTAKTTELQAAVLEHGTKMQAYRHNKQCRELGGRVVLHCNQILIPGIGLENGFCYGLAYQWAEQVIKNDKFMGFRGNHDAFIQPTSGNEKILQVLPSFNDFIRIDARLFKTQETQEGARFHNYKIKIEKPDQQFQEFSELIIQKANKSENSAVFCAYYTDTGAHVVALRKRKKPNPQGFLIDYFDANSGWMQFKDETSFKTFIIYYLKDRNAKETINHLALAQFFPVGYSPIIKKLAEAQALQRPRANSFRLSEPGHQVKLFEKASAKTDEQLSILKNIVYK